MQWACEPLDDCPWCQSAQREQSFITRTMRRPSKEGHMPFDEFPYERRLAIAEAVSEPRPPRKWINFGLGMIPSRAWFEWHWQRGVDPDKRRPTIPDWLRQFVYERDGYACLACGSEKDLSLDHIVHFSRGGRDVEGNLRTLCRSCNSQRRTKTDEEWGRLSG